MILARRTFYFLLHDLAEDTSQIFISTLRYKLNDLAPASNDTRDNFVAMQFAQTNFFFLLYVI